MGHSAPDSLVITETEDAYVLAYGDDPDDWIVNFCKSASFPARRWADRLVQLHNQQQRAMQKVELRNEE